MRVAEIKGDTVQFMYFEKMERHDRKKNVTHVWYKKSTELQPKQYRMRIMACIAKLWWEIKGKVI